MRLWVGAAHFKGYEMKVSAHYVLASSEESAKALVLEEALKGWPEWWPNYPHEIFVKPVPFDIVTAVANQDLR